MQSSTAFLFDLNGTMVDDMHYHIKAWHKILTDLGANLTLQQMKEECYGKNDELLERIFPGRFTMEEKKTMSIDKESTYQKVYQPDLALITGLDTFLNSATANGIQMAIGSAATAANRLLSALPIGANDVMIWDTALVLNAGETLQGLSDTAAKVTVTVVGWEKQTA
jgi:beta-phosphoglucomutase-like phosphatase (HAD superfamily)